MSMEWASWRAVPPLSILGADQLVRPPADGLPFLRHDRAGELDLGPGALSVRGGRIAALAADATAPVQIDAGGGAVVPGFVDAHTHLPFAWDDGPVLPAARRQAAELLREGTTAFECRGASLEQLRLAARLTEAVEQESATTAEVAAEQVAAVVAATRVRALATDEAGVAAAGPAAAAHDLWLRVNAPARVGAALEHGARSVHGLTELHANEIAPLAAADTAAVLLPAAELLHADHLAPGRRLADGGAICVLASGLHPRRAPASSMPLLLGLAARLYGFDAREALLAATLNAAWALGRSADLGSLEPGKRADLLVLDAPVEALTHRLGRNPVAVVVCGGELAWVRPDQAWRVTVSE
jgi:imidazolonepropionase